MEPSKTNPNFWDQIPRWRRTCLVISNSSQMDPSRDPYTISLEGGQMRQQCQQSILCKLNSRFCVLLVPETCIDRFNLMFSENLTVWWQCIFDCIPVAFDINYFPCQVCDLIYMLIFGYLLIYGYLKLHDIDNPWYSSFLFFYSQTANHNRDISNWNQIQWWHCISCWYVRFLWLLS